MNFKNLIICVLTMFLLSFQSMSHAENDAVQNDDNNLGIFCNEAEDGIMLMSENIVEYPISKGETYRFENFDDSAHAITGLTNYIDYVIYYQNGSVKEYNFNQKPGSLSVPVGGVAVITSINEKIYSYIEDDYFLAEQIDTPAMHRANMMCGETYEFVNNGMVAYDWLTCDQYNSGHHYDYVVYEADGTVKAYEPSVRYSNISIPAGGKIVVTSIGQSGTECAAIFDKFTMTKKDTFAMRRANMVCGETYEFVNNGTIAYDWLTCDQYNSGHDYDYVVYEADGTVKAYEPSARYSNISIPAGGKIVVTSIGQYGTECTAIFDKFTMTKKDTSAMHHANMLSGETYEFVNNGTIAYDWLTCYQKDSGHDYDYVVYEADGTVKAYEPSARYSNISIPAGGKIVVTSVGQYGTECAVIFDKFAMAKKDTFAMHRANMLSGETYEFVNNSTIAYDWLTCYQKDSGHDYDYVVYETDNSILSQGINSRNSNISVPAGGRIVVTSIGQYGTECAVIFDKFAMAKKDTPALCRKNMTIGDSYIYYNVSGNNCNFITANQNYTGHHYTYTVYNSDGAITETETNSRKSEIVVPAGGKIELTAAGNYGTECGASFEKFIVEKNGSSNDLIDFDSNATYKIINIGKTDVEFSCGTKFDFVIFGTDNEITSMGINQSSKIVIPIGYYALVQNGTIFDSKITKNEFLKYDLSKDDAITKVLMQKNETYEFTNMSERILNLKTNQKKFDFINYNREGTIENYGVKYSNQTIEVSPGGKIKITSREQGLVVGAITAKYNVNKSEATAFKHQILHSGDVYTIKNNSTKGYKIFTNGNKHNYIKYSAENSILAYDTFINSSNYTLEAGEIITLTALDTVDVAFINDSFTGTEIDQDIYNVAYIGKDRTNVIKNSSDREYKLFIKTGIYDYVIYDENDNITHSVTNSTSKYITLDSGYKLAITSISQNTVIYGISNVFDIKERTYPAMLRKYVKYGEKVNLINNTNDIVTLYSHNGVYSYVIYDENGSEAENRKYQAFNNKGIPANGKIDILVHSATSMLAGPYEAFSNDDLTIHPTGVSISAHELKLSKGKQKFLKAIVYPDDVTNDQVVWESSDTGIITVTQTGKITAKAVGTAVVTATSVDGEHSASCVVKVVNGTPTGIVSFSANIESDNFSVNISTVDIPADATICVVTYNQQGVLCEIKFAKLNDNLAQATLSASGVTIIKAFAWNSQKMQPLCDQAIRKIK